MRETVIGNLVSSSKMNIGRENAEILKLMA